MKWIEIFIYGVYNGNELTLRGRGERDSQRAGKSVRERDRHGQRERERRGKHELLRHTPKAK